MNILIGFLLCYFGFNILLIIGIAIEEIRGGAFDDKIEWLEVLINLFTLFFFGVPLAIVKVLR